MNAVSHQLHAVPDTPPRVLGAIRVSKKGDRGDDLMSPDIQRTAIIDHCATHGYQIVGWIEGIDESGSRAKSAWWPRLEGAVAEVEAGTYDGIVVWRLSRFARERLKRAVLLDRVERAGGFMESAVEKFDTSTPTGRLARGVVGELDTFMSEMIGHGWQEAHSQRVAAGKPASGKDRFGYLYDREQKLHVPDPETGPLLAELYRRYTSGESVYALVSWLNSHGYRTKVGGLWSDRRLRYILDSGFAAGTFTHKGVRHDGVHEPLISREQWQAYLDARESRRHRGARAERSEYLLSGMVRCAHCGRPMVANTVATRDTAHTGPRYRCKASSEHGRTACPRGGYVQTRLVEEFVVDWLREKADRVDAATTEADVADARRISLETDGRRLARELARVEESLTRLAVQNAEQPLPDGVYRRAADELLARQASLEASLEAVRRDQRRAVDDVSATARGLLEEWDELTLPQRREILRGLVDCVLVRTGRPRVSFMRVVEWHEVRA